jgi:hypothetical protein
VDKPAPIQAITINGKVPDDFEFHGSAQAKPATPAN